MFLIDMTNKENLTATERELAEYIYRNAVKVIHMNQNDLAEAAYVSPATISRFCRKMDCQNYGDFKVLLASEIEASMRKVINNNYPFSSDADLKEIADNIYSSNLASLKSCHDHLDKALIDRIVDGILLKKSVDIYALGSTAGSCVSFSEHMSRISYLTNVYDNTSHYMFYSTLEKDSYKMIISHSGKLSKLIRISERMHEYGVPYLLITANRFSPMVNNADLVYIVNTDEELTINGKMGMFSSQSSLIYLLNVIYSAVFARNYKENVEKIKASAVFQLSEIGK